MPEPTNAAISARAHAIWLSRGSRPGRALDDWLQAERELRAEAARPSSPATGAPSTFATAPPSGAAPHARPAPPPPAATASFAPPLPPAKAPAAPTRPLSPPAPGAAARPTGSNGRGRDDRGRSKGGKKRR